MCVACESRVRSLTSHARPPQQPQGHPCRSRARTGAPHGVSGGASQGPAARQTRLDVTRPHPRSGRAVLDVTCAHNADAGEGKQGVEINFYARECTKSTQKTGMFMVGDAMNAAGNRGRIARKQGREASPSTSVCGRQPKERLFARRRWTTCDGRTMPQVSRGARACA